MAQIDVIPLASAKDWLSVDENDDATNAQITRLINTAVDWVENYTSHRLWQRAENVITSDRDITLAQYPISVTSVKDSTNADQTFYTKQQALKLRLKIGHYHSITFNNTYGANTYTIALQVGYDAVSKIPGPLLDACYKLITYLYENRDSYQVAMPTDIQMLINQYRRKLI